MTLKSAVRQCAASAGVVCRLGACTLLAGLLAAGTASAQDTVLTTPRTAHLVGRVTDQGGTPLGSAQVVVMPSMKPQAVTDDSGAFHLDGIPVGRVQFAVRRLGFEAATFTAQLKAGRVQRVTFPLTAIATHLAEVDVNDTTSHPWLRIFDQRREHGLGRFITRDDLLKYSSQVTADVLRQIPGVLVKETSRGIQVLFQRSGIIGGTQGVGACPPQVYVGNMKYSGPITDFYPDDIEAMEVYVGMGEVPIELQGSAARTCGAIVVWTREPTPAPKKPPPSDTLPAARPTPH